MKKLFLLLVFCMVFIINTAYSQWQEANNGLYGGLTLSFMVNNGYLFAGTAGGMYRSSNNGTTWVSINSGLPNYYCRDLIVLNSNLYVATWGGGVYLTTDNGSSWSSRNSGLSNLNVYTLFVKGTNLYAGTASGGLFLSTDNGSSWHSSSSGIPNAGVVSFAVIGDSIYAGINNGGVYLSSNNGASWSARNNGLTGTDVNAITVNNNNIYAATQTHGVYLSTDEGASWATANNGLTNLSVLHINQTGIFVFAATNGGGIFKSSDNGSNWTTVNNGLFSTYVLRLYFNGAFMYAGADGGAFLSSNMGINWNDISSGLRNGCIIYLTKDASNNIYAGTYGRGAFKSTNNGASWSEINNGIAQLYIYSIATTGNNVFAGTWSGDISLSTNNGTSWSTVYQNSNKYKIWSMIVSGSNIFAALNGGGVLLSTNNGTNWNTVNTGLSNLNAYCLAVNGSNLFVGTTGGGVFLSTNNGTSWSAKNFGLSNLNVYYLLISGSNIFAGTAGGVYFSSNNGSSWSSRNNTIGSQLIRSLTVSGTNLFACGTGAYFSSNNGTNWKAINSGLVNTNNWAINIVSNTVFIGTYGNGVFDGNITDFGGSAVTSITTGSISSPICAGSQISVPFTANGVYNLGNIFTAQLSDLSGGFSNPTNIGTLTGTSSGIISSAIPKNTSQGPGYRIRVTASSPATIGSDNGSNILINSSPSPVIQGTFVICRNTSQTYTTTSTSGHSYKWKSSGGIIVGADSLSNVLITWVTPNPSGTVTVTETINSSGCRDTTFQAITIRPVPSPSIDDTSAVCNKSNHVYTSPRIIGHSYVWSVTGGVIIGPSNQNSVQINWNTNKNSSTLTLKETNDTTGCNTSISHVFTVNPLPTPLIDGNLIVCRYSIETYSTTFTPGDSFKWVVTGGNLLNDDTLPVVMVYWRTPQSTGNIEVIVTHTLTGCTDSTSQVITIHDKQTAVIDGAIKTCSNITESYLCPTTSGVSFKWTTLGGGIIGPDNQGTVHILWLSGGSGTVTLYLTLLTTGCVDSTFIVVRVDSLPNPSIIGNDSTSINKTEKYVVRNPIGGDSYTWDVWGGDIIGNPHQQDIKVQWTSSGSGTITLTETVDTTGCENSTFMLVNVTDIPFASFDGPVTACINNTTDYTTVPIPGCSNIWSAKGGIILGANNLETVQIQWLTLGSDNVSMLLTLDSTGYKDSTKLVVKVNPLPTPIIKGADSTSIDTTEHYTVQLNQGSAYKWWVQGGQIKGMTILSYVDIIWGNGKSGKLHVTETTKDGCIDSSSINVTLITPPPPNDVNDSKTDAGLFQIFPNPAKDYLQINFSSGIFGNISIKIINELGIELFDNMIDYSNSNSFKIDTKKYPTGIYFCIIKAGNYIEIKKIMIIK